MVTIRPYRSDDVDAVYEAVIESHAQLTPWMPWCHANYSRDDAMAWVESRADAWEADTELSFVITDREGNWLGGCGLNRLDHLNATANLGYWVRTSRTRRGTATAAVKRVVEYAYRNTELNRLEILTAIENLASQRVAERVGATREARLRQRIRVQDGLQDAVAYSILRSDTLT